MYAVSTGEVASLEKAFYTLAAYKFLSYNEAKRRYHAARRDDRFKPIIVRLEDQVKLISEKKMVRELADAEVIFPRDSGHGVKLLAQITSVSDVR